MNDISPKVHHIGDSASKADESQDDRHDHYLRLDGKVRLAKLSLAKVSFAQASFGQVMQGWTGL